tara:strand:+ start:612 stop:731 length:120 start_codon:yes stop_codon:yes gene_type:complete
MPTYVSKDAGTKYQPGGSQEASGLFGWASFDRMLGNGLR